jgi:hypothetical protein
MDLCKLNLLMNCICWCQVNQHFIHTFFIRKCFAHLSLVTFLLCNFWRQNIGAKFASIMLMKFTQGHIAHTVENKRILKKKQFCHVKALVHTQQLNPLYRTTTYCIHDLSIRKVKSRGQFHQHACVQLLTMQILCRLTSISPTILCPTLSVHSTRSYTQLLCCTIYTVH